jgi:hypothetical protein
MTGSYRIEPRSGLVLLDTVGIVRQEDWEATVLPALAAAASYPSRRVLSDRRRPGPPTPPGFVHDIIRGVRSRAAEFGDIQWAVVANDRDDNYALALLAEDLARATRVRVKVFSSMVAALEWLIGVSDEEEVARLEAWIESASGAS